MEAKKKSHAVSAIFLIFLILSFSPPSFAADIRMAPPSEQIDTSKILVISGDIERGDTESLINLILGEPKEEVPIATLILGPSAGGNVEEAMSIGFLVRTLKWKVVVLDHCYSACALIALSGVYRTFAGEVGLHRPYFDPEFYGEMDPFYVEQWHQRVNRQVRKFLEDTYVSASIIEKMMSVSSRGMWILSASEADSTFSNFHPYFEEFIHGRCGDQPVTIPEYGVNSECLTREIAKMQRQSLITFLKAVMDGRL